jgi:hypothetical protein
MTLKEFIPDKIKNFLKWTFWNEKRILKKNLSLKGKGKGKRAFILATGPSINQEDLKILRGEDCYSISNFYLHEDIEIIKPKFHFFAPYHQPLIFENYIEWLNNADKILPETAKIFLAQSGYDLVKKNGLFKNRDVYYMFLSNTKKHKKINLLKPVPSPQTGVHMILNLLIYMGYSEIYLLGCDANFLKFYKEQRENFYDKNKDLRKSASDTECWGNVYNALKMELVTHNKYLNYKNCFKGKIINLSKESWLEMFDKMDLQDVVKKNS